MNGERRSVESPQISGERLSAIPLPVAERQGYHQLTTTTHTISNGKRCSRIGSHMVTLAAIVSLDQFLAPTIRRQCWNSAPPSEESKNMIRRVALASLALMLCLAVPLAQAAPPTKGASKAEPSKPKTEPNKSEPSKPKSEPNKPKSEPGKTSSSEPHGNSAPGGSWSEPTHNAGKSTNQASGHPGAEEKSNSPTGANNPAKKNPNSNASGAKGAAAGAAAANRNAPKATGAEGAAAGVAVANRNSPQVSGAEGAALGGAAVRNSYNNPNLYNAEWYGANPGAWAPIGQAAGAAWAPTTWAAIASYCGASTTPVAYNYGTNVTCEGGNVTAAGQDLGTAAEFSQQAATLAQAGAATDVANTDEWLPLGVFAMVRNEQQHAQLILQLAINKQGILRGNYTDELTEQTQLVQGSVDPKTQRAAWTVGDNKLSVIEAGLSNLSEDEAPVLIHRRGLTDHWLLVRLNQPGQDANAAADPPKPQ